MSGLVFDRLELAKEYIKERIQLSDLVARHSKLVKEPRGFKCLCPMPGHREKTPSFHIDVRKNLFYCYGCSKGGDIFEFVKQVEGLDFIDALKEFADQLDVELPKPKRGAASFGVSSSVKDTLSLLDRASKFFQKCLLQESSVETTRALSYLRERGISDEQIQQFGLGWAPDKRDAIVKSLKTDVEKTLAQKAGLISLYNNRAYDFFSNRLMIPIRDVRGRDVAFSGRSLDEVTSKNPKYKNSPETDLFKKKWVLYGLSESLPIIRQKDFVVVVEGFFDQWALLKRGIPSVAVMGTALTEDHVRTLKKYCSEVILFLDADEAGQNAVLRSLPIMVKEGLDTKVFVAPEGKDPDEWLSIQGSIDDEKLEMLLRSASEGLKWWAEYKITQGERQGSNSVQIMKSLVEVWEMAPNQAHRRVLAQSFCSIGSMTAEQFYSSMNSMIDRSSSGYPRRNDTYRQGPAMAKVAKLDPLAAEIFEMWLSAWSTLTPNNHRGWERLEDIFQGSALASLVSEMGARFVRQHGSLTLAEVELLIAELKEVDEVSLGRFRKAIFEADAGESDSSKLEKGFEELCHMAESRKIDVEIRKIRQKIKNLPENSPETEQLLHSIKELLHKRNNDLEKTGKGTSVGSL